MYPNKNTHTYTYMYIVHTCIYIQYIYYMYMYMHLHFVCTCTYMYMEFNVHVYMYSTVDKEIHTLYAAEEPVNHTNTLHVYVNIRPTYKAQDTLMLSLYIIL